MTSLATAQQFFMHVKARIETLNESLLSENPPVKGIENENFISLLLTGRKKT